MGIFPSRSLQVDIWSDIACPWCWIGKRNLEQALAEVDGEVRVVWRSFELDRSAPRDRAARKSLVDHLGSKYGTTPAQTMQMIERVNAIGASVGIGFRFDRVKVVRTFDAHRVLHLAARRGLQDPLKERLFRAYMIEGRVVSDPETLVEVASEVGLDSDEVATALRSGQFDAEVRRDQSEAARRGVYGVPFFAVGARHTIEGAQSPERIRDALVVALGEARRRLTPTWSRDAPSCAPGTPCDPLPQPE